MKKIYFSFLCIFSVNLFAEDIDFLQRHDLSNDTKRYPYASTLSFGISPNYFSLFSGEDKEDKIKNINLNNFFSLGFSFQYSWLLSNMFSVRTFGFIPRIGFAIQLFSMNYVRTYFEEIFKSLGKIFICNPSWNPQPLNALHFTINIPIIFEPEISIFSSFRCVPQLGIGISIINLIRDCAPNRDNKKKIYSKYIDLLFLAKTSFIWKNNHIYETKISFGYTYNPLLGYDYGTGTKNGNKNIEGGLMNVFIEITFNWYFYLGRETIDWFDNNLKKIKNNKKTFFIDCCFGIGNWYTCSVDNIKTTKYFNILVSLNFPYLRKITDVLYYGVNIDLFEDLFNNANKNKDYNFFKKAINNFNTIFNFASFSFVYKTIRITHNFGIYVITSLWDIFSKRKKILQREISENTGDDSGFEDKVDILNYLLGRFTYRPRIYINIPKMLRKRAKYNLLNKFSLIIGVNTILFDRRNDWWMKKTGQINFEFVKIESVFVGISYEI